MSTNYFLVRTTEHLSEHRNYFLYLALVWTFFMAYLCLTDFNKLPNIRIGGLDKTVHFVLHCCFTFFWYLYFMKAQKCMKYRLVIVIAASIIYGSLIEIAQALFTTTRKADILDIVANSVGTAGGCVAIYVTKHFARKMI